MEYRPGNVEFVDERGIGMRMRVEEREEEEEEGNKGKGMKGVMNEGSNE